MNDRNNYRSRTLILFLTLFLAGGFAAPAFAEDLAATTSQGTADVTAATTTISTAESTLTAESTTTIPVSETTTAPPVSEATTTAPVSEPPPVLGPPEPAPEPSPSPAPLPSAPEPEPSQVTPPPSPQPVAEPVAPFESSTGKAFDPTTAPSKVRLKILDPSGNAPTIPVFVTFVGVGGRTYGGPIDREGALETIMPTGRYYTDFLVIDTKLGPPADPPSFFLEANEERDFGVLVLTDKSSFADTALESEIASTLEGKGGLAKIFSLIVKLLLAILKEIRGLRSELVGR